MGSAIEAISILKYYIFLFCIGWLLPTNRKPYPVGYFKMVDALNVHVETGHICNPEVIPVAALANQRDSRGSEGNKWQ